MLHGRDGRFWSDLCEYYFSMKNFEQKEFNDKTYTNYVIIHGK